MPLFSDAAPRTASPNFVLKPGQALLPMEGWYWYKPGHYSQIQRYDPVARMWKFCGDDSQAERFLYFDGATTRIANTTGCVVGAVVTTAGSGYTTAPTVTAAAGGAVFQAVVGGAISTAATIAVAGAGYVYPPVLWIEQPPQPGTQAAAVATISGGTISAVTLIDQGSGYLFPPTCEVLNDPRDTVGYGGQVTLALTGAGTITSLLVTDHGNPITSGTVPALTFSAGAGAATAVMDWSVNSVSITTAGAGYVTSGDVLASGAGGYVSATPAYLGGMNSIGMTRYRPAIVDVATDASGSMSAVSAIIDGGHYQGVPFATIVAAAAPTTTGVLAFTMGGLNTAVFLMPAQKS